MLELNAGYELARHAPGFFAFGSSGGGELLALDLRGEKPWKVVMLPAIPLDPEEAVVDAEDFSAFTRAMGEVGGGGYCAFRVLSWGARRRAPYEDVCFAFHILQRMFISG